MKKLMKSMALLALVGAIMAGAAGCGRKTGDTVAEKAMEHAIKSAAKEDGQDVAVDIDIDKGTMSIKGPQGGMQIRADEGQMTISGKDGAQDVTYKADGDSFTMTTPEGTLTTSSGKSAKVPDGFPKDVPIYPGAEVVSATSMAQMGMASVQLSTGDGVAKVAAYYKRELAAKGWNEVTAMSQGGAQAMEMLSCSKGETVATVMAVAEEGKTIISVTIGKQ